jgi:DNA-binding response OmpR family regulator
MPARKTTILTADDDPQLLRLMTRNLELEGYDVLSASDGQQALEEIERKIPDLVLLDVMMPKMDGFTVCHRVRGFSSAPIIIVTARGQDQDKVRGLDLGADDYLTKPFSVDELLARVRAVLRRSQFSAKENTLGLQATSSTGDLTIDYGQHLVTKAGEEIQLTPTEYCIFAYLAQNAGRVVTQDLLLEHVWGAEYLGESHMLQVNINRLRRKLEADPAQPRYILTKIGIGYALASLPPVGEWGTSLRSEKMAICCLRLSKKRERRPTRTASPSYLTSTLLLKHACQLLYFDLDLFGSRDLKFGNLEGEHALPIGGLHPGCIDVGGQGAGAREFALMAFV